MPSSEAEFISGVVLSILAFILNSSEALFLIRQRARKTKYQNLVLSLAVADILASSFFVVCFTNKNDRNIMRIIQQELLWFSVSSSLLHVLAISFDRLLAIRFPLKHRFWFTCKKNMALIVIIWILSFLLIAPSLAVSLQTGKNNLIKQISSSLVIVTGLLLILLYAYIIRRTVSKECIFQIITLQSGKKEIVSACSLREKRILLTSALIVLSFIICNFPFAIVYIVTKQRQEYLILFLITNSILNPLIYFFQRYYQDKREETVRRKTDQSRRPTQEVILRELVRSSPRYENKNSSDLIKTMDLLHVPKIEEDGESTASQVEMKTVDNTILQIKEESSGPNTPNMKVEEEHL